MSPVTANSRFFWLLVPRQSPELIFRATLKIDRKCAAPRHCMDASVRGALGPCPAPGWFLIGQSWGPRCGVSTFGHPSNSA